MRTNTYLCGNCSALVHLVLVTVLTTGCMDSGPAKIQPIEIDPQSAAQRLLEKYDANGDGALDEAELASEPAVAGSFQSIDRNADGQLSQDEAAGFFQSMFTGTSLMGVECRVLLDGRPLPEAVVKLTPSPFLDEALHPAEGTSDQSGTARPTVAAEFIPENLQGAPLMAPGIYRVEITHPKVSLPDRYNTATELQMLVDPTQRGGSSATFDLRSK